MFINTLLFARGFGLDLTCTDSRVQRLVLFCTHNTASSKIHFTVCLGVRTRACVRVFHLLVRVRARVHACACVCVRVCACSGVPGLSASPLVLMSGLRGLELGLAMLRGA